MLVRFCATACIAAALFATPSYPMREAAAAAVVCQQSLLTRLAFAEMGGIITNNVVKGRTIVGAASTYNPYRRGYREGGKETASGEQYDPTAWTAAIQTNLRDEFRGVRYGKDYQNSFALVESADKKAIIKINDVGPLTPGRIIDLNEQTMRYFDPTFTLGVVQSVKVTPLFGNDWSTGPI